MNISPFRSVIGNHQIMSTVAIVVLTTAIVALTILFLGSYPVTAVGVGLLAVMGGVMLETFVIACYRSVKQNKKEAESESVVCLPSFIPPSVAQMTAAPAPKEEQLGYHFSRETLAALIAAEQRIAAKRAAYQEDTATADSHAERAVVGIPRRRQHFGAMIAPTATCGCFFATCLQSHADFFDTILSSDIPMPEPKPSGWSRDEITGRRELFRQFYLNAKGKEQVDYSQLRELREDIADKVMFTTAEDKHQFLTDQYDASEAFSKIIEYLAIPLEYVNTWDLNTVSFVGRFSDDFTKARDKAFLFTEVLPKTVEVMLEGLGPQASIEAKERRTKALTYPAELMFFPMQRFCNPDMGHRAAISWPNMLLFPLELRSDMADCLAHGTDHELESFYLENTSHYVSVVLEGDEFVYYNCFESPDNPVAETYKIEGLRALLGYLWDNRDLPQETLRQEIARRRWISPSLDRFLKDHNIFSKGCIRAVAYRKKVSSSEAGPV